MVLWHNEILNAHILKRLFDYFSNYKYRNSNTKYANHANQVHLFMKYHLADVTQYDTITLHDHYTHTSLNFVMNVYNKHHGGNIQLTLIGNTCLRYDKKDLVESSSVFRNWYSILQKFKLKFPKNKLIKHLASSAWDHLVSTNTIIKSEQQIEDEGIEFSPNLDDDDARYYLREIVTQSNGFTFYKLVDKNKPYFKHQFRIKPFLLSHCRRTMANLVLNNADKVIRIITDSITYEGR
ncbi:hypothetical protein DYB34_010277 [Aphanomyces astaci]|uniref:Uncharacterized protein n=1 Tax=Aphanomyces astaci TaxID=112090 RepID=A0A418C1I4_APHAT|nr:hypothetical protein DYB34_010277 [Aphanomyces astaci]